MKSWKHFEVIKDFKEKAKVSVHMQAIKKYEQLGLIGKKSLMIRQI